MIKAGRIAMRRRTAVTFPGVQSDMMMITTSREKRRLLPVALREFESQHVTIEHNCAIKVGDLQMNVSDADVRVNWLRLASSRAVVDWIVIKTQSSRSQVPRSHCNGERQP